MVIEQKEPHVGRMAFGTVEQPSTFAERCTLARRIRDELELPLPIYVDGMDDASRALFSDLPGPAFVLDRWGRIVDKQEWVDPDALTQGLERLVANESLPANATDSWGLEERNAAARQRLAAGDPVQALQWLDAVSDPAPASPTAAASALAAITRAITLARHKAAEPQRVAAIDAATQLVGIAWPDNAARRTAAHIELAEAAAGTTAAASAWQKALDGLDAKAPVEARVWIKQQRDTSSRR